MEGAGRSAEAAAAQVLGAKLMGLAAAKVSARRIGDPDGNPSIDVVNAGAGVVEVSIGWQRPEVSPAAAALPVPRFPPAPPPLFPSESLST